MFQITLNHVTFPSALDKDFSENHFTFFYFTVILIVLQGAPPPYMHT